MSLLHGRSAVAETPKRCFACRVLVQGAGPSARYAHTLSLVANRFLVAMGGNDGKSTLGDAWALDTSEKPYAWRKITDAGEMPSPRYAWSVSVHCFVLCSYPGQLLL